MPDSMQHPSSFNNMYQQQQQQHMHSGHSMQQQQMVPGGGALHRAGSAPAPLMHSPLNMQGSGPGPHSTPLGYSPSVPQALGCGSGLLSPAPSSGGYNGCGGYHSSSGGGMGHGSSSRYSAPGFGVAAPGEQVVGEGKPLSPGAAPAPGMKVKLKVQVAPMRRGRGRPPSRARLAAREVELIPVEVPESPKAPAAAAAAAQGPDAIWHEQQHMQQQQQMVMHPHPSQQGMMQQQQPHSMMQQQHGLYDRQQGMYGAPPSAAGMYTGVVAGMMMPVGGPEGSLGAGMVPLGFDGGLQQQQQRKRSGNSSDLEGLKPTKSVKVRAGCEAASAVMYNRVHSL